ncbi:MAG: LLM class flavin-dependent oxidoreductase [Thermoleophilaceae bacterium]
MSPAEESPPGSPPLRLSVLDQSPIPAQSSGAEALRNTLDLARLADELGYHRYWVAEHHGSPALAGASPEVLVGPIAARTDRIRVGSGGVMLPHYSPWKVAESFSVLSGLFGDRIDLGLGRGASADAVTTHALQRDRRVPSPSDFGDQLTELIAHLEGRPPPDARFAALGLLPGSPAGPQPWLLGSSLQSAIWAARHGISYAFGDFINPEGREMTHLYSESFVASATLAAPRVAVCVAAVCADGDADARRLATSARAGAAMQRDGHGTVPVPTVEQAESYLSRRDPDAEESPRRTVVGDPAAVRARLEELAAEYRANEVMVVTITHSHAARRRSYELIAEAFGLGRG